MIRATVKELEANQNFLEILFKLSGIRPNATFGSKLTKVTTKTFLQQYTDAVEPLYKLI
jgi:hypothetical protein